MNGQTARLEIVRSIIEKCEIEQIIETGTHRGTTTEWFSQFGLPVFSAELLSRFAAFARRRVAGRTNVHIENFDSIEALNRWSNIPGIASKRTLFYLDAHWQKHLPLCEELKLIDRNFKFWVVVIDDFRVPLDDDYGFDDYGPGQVLDMDYINRCGIKRGIAFFPSVSGKWETGEKRGYMVLVSDQEFAKTCSAMQLLRPAAVFG